MTAQLLQERKRKFENLRKLRYGDDSRKMMPERDEEYAAEVLKNVLTQCPDCGQSYSKDKLRENLYTCPACGHHYTMPVLKRVLSIADEGSFQVFRYQFPEIDPLHFDGYLEKKAEMREKNKQDEAVLTGVGKIAGIKCVIAVMNSRFLMGSMGVQLGETVTRAVEYADKNHLPLILFSASGGARMQEGIFSLMQMAKTAAAVQRFRDHGGLYIVCLTHPTTGGVSASFAGLGDITLAEPGALIGFAGPRVIQQTIGQKLPEGFQRAEYLEKHGFVDQIVPRAKMRKVLRQLLVLHGRDASRGRGREVSRGHGREVSRGRLKAEYEAGKAAGVRSYLEQRRKDDLSPMDKVLLARGEGRPNVEDYQNAMFTGFFEQKGDLLGTEDTSIFGGIALFHGIPVTVIGHRKGKTQAENQKYNYGMPGPEGYRKALRMMKAAEKYGRPIITLIDTPGAYPGIEAENGGQSQAIAENLAAMSSLRVPVIAVITGEGNSGGALALGVADKVFMLEHAVYSILSPEGFSTILWQDATKKEKASRVMKLTAQDLLQGHIIDGIVPEPRFGAQADPKAVYEKLDRVLLENLYALLKVDADDLPAKRYEKFRNMDQWIWK